ncbi:MAG: F0F1 ATP synthase subunit epsilon, partial [Dehalococcoidales bacterium]|nr:F0F1 ATP synthase subunit epsilon [Dehalococcoidales bacterium]
MPIKFDIVTAERLVFSDQVDEVVAPGTEGELGILPHHAPLMTMLKPGEIMLRKSGEQISLAVAGGFLEVRPDHVIVLADAAERADEIDTARAEAAKKRAQERLVKSDTEIEKARAEAALRRAIARLDVAEKRKRARKG